MEGGELGQEDGGQGDKVEGEVEGVVARVGAGQDEERDGDDGEELTRGRVLHAVVQLLPVGQAAGGALVERHPGLGLHLEEARTGGQGKRKGSIATTGVSYYFQDLTNMISLSVSPSAGTRRRRRCARRR